MPEIGGSSVPRLRTKRGWEPPATMTRNRDPAGTKQMLAGLDDAFAKAGRTRGSDFQIIITPPLTMPVDAMQEYAELGVHRLVVNLGSQHPERVPPRMAEIETLVQRAT